MSLFAIWPMIAVVGAVIALLSLRAPFRFLDQSANIHAHRSDSLDGLRGLLATGVAFHHLMLLGWGIRTGQPGLPPSHFYSILGEMGVALFFMITGYLFWGKLVDSGGILDWPRLYIGRFFRIYPLYLFTVLAYFAFCLIAWNGPIDSAPTHVASQAFQWLTVRLFASEPTPFLGITPFYGMMGQTWTLRYEWIFYLSLPLLAVFARERSHLAISIVALCIIVAMSEHLPMPYGYFAVHFVCGVVVGSLLRAYPALRGDSIARTALAAIMAVVAFRFTDGAYTVAGSLALLAFFLMVTAGVSFGGLLKCRGAARLGNFSYSLYLLHGLIINAVLADRWILGFLKLRTPEWFWVVADGIYLLEIAVCACTYFFIERGGVALGKRISALVAPAGNDKTEGGTGRRGERGLRDEVDGRSPRNSDGLLGRGETTGIPSRESAVPVSVVEPKGSQAR